MPSTSRSYMTVGQHEPVGRDHDPRAEPATLARVPYLRTCFDADHGRPDAFCYVDDGIGISVDQRAVVGGGLLGRLRWGGLMGLPLIEGILRKIQHGEFLRVSDGKHI
jgi:hypothetical protein